MSAPDQNYQDELLEVTAAQQTSQTQKVGENIVAHVHDADEKK